MATNLANESISVVKQKYGEDASVLTENAAYAVGNSALTAYYVGGLGPKAVSHVQISIEFQSFRSDRPQSSQTDGERNCQECIHLNKRAMMLFLTCILFSQYFSERMSNKNQRSN